MSFRGSILLCLLSALLGGLLAIGLYDSPQTESKSVAQEPVRPLAAVPAAPGASGADDYADLTPEERVNVMVYEQVNRSVVNITTRSARTSRLLIVEIPSEGEGSGSVLDKQGHVLTSFHVIDGAREIRVNLYDGTSYPARPVGYDPISDVAVLKIDAPAESLYPVTLGDSTRLRVGQRVFAIGNPFGLERTLTTGIISSLNRSLPSQRTHRKMDSIIQIDAAINPGSSGGPLLDTHGRVIGMNMAIASSTGDNAGVAFSVPVGTIERVLPQLLKNGRVVRPEIGIARVYQTEQGLLIATLIPGGPAERAGLQGPRVVRKRQGPFVYESVDRSAADLIVAVDGKRVKTADDFLDVIESKQPGDQVVVTVMRGGREMAVPVQLAPGE